MAGCHKADKPQKQADGETPSATTAPAGTAPAKATDKQAKLAIQPAETGALDAATVAEAQKLINGGIEYLLKNQDPDGGWSIHGAFKPAITALVLKALVRHPSFPADSPVVKKGFDVLLSYQQPDGAIYDPKQGRSNYCTAIAVCALAAAKNPKFKPQLDKAVAYLRSLQIVPGSESRDPKKPGEKIAPGHPYTGGVSYGAEHGRPDLNNLGWWMEAMHEAGIPADDPAMQRALAFVTRCQNRSESNPRAWAQQGAGDGGMIYAPAKRDASVGESKAGPGPGGKGLASYGSISYVGLKSMLYAGLTKDDPRVKSLFAWVRRNWTLDRNPGMPKVRSQQGVYYYYHVFSRGLRAWGQDEIRDISNPKVKHNWRKQLIEALAKRVRADGSWVNPTSRWEEGSPILVTAYEVLALQESLMK